MDNPALYCLFSNCSTWNNLIVMDSAGSSNHSRHHYIRGRPAVGHGRPLPVVTRVNFPQRHDVRPQRPRLAPTIKTRLGDPTRPVLVHRARVTRISFPTSIILVVQPHVGLEQGKPGDRHQIVSPAEVTWVRRKDRAERTDLNIVKRPGRRRISPA